ncbi:MAG: aminodeoxychorismate synthase component I [Gammaproteobacteria bacterium]|nr:aminodeoxychorismate synthase component I [Gammaproteobacteria bacterium]
MEHAYFLSRTLASIPDLLALHAEFPDRYPHLLASNSTSAQSARFDILFACPQQTLMHTDAEFLSKLDALWLHEKVPPSKNDLPFTGGWFLYLGYELAADIEPAVHLPTAQDGLPVAFATRFVAAVIVDRISGVAHIVCEHESEHCVDTIQSDIEQVTHIEASRKYQQPIRIAELVEDDSVGYLQHVERIKRYILDGDVFQVNLSRAWRTQLLADVSDAGLYWHLAKNNPGPFNALVTLGDSAIISSSPERLVEVRDQIVQTRPIAGTRPRSNDNTVDSELSNELMKHPKERAEHIMLIDLERNDLGRICQPGTVEVNELMVLESYQHVHHIVSNVRGRMRSGITPGDVIKAVFPGGTITGCPKVRCMQILAELEQTGRGAYTGSLGYLNRDGSMDLNILIRTLVRHGKQLMFRAGGGIVADSDPQHELAETRAKAKGLVMALKS